MKKTILTLSILVLLLTACGAQKYAAEPAMVREGGVGYGSDMVMEEALEMEASSAPEAGTQNVADSTTSAQIERMVIKNATLSIVVADPTQTLEKIMSMADEMGGFVVTSNLWQTTLSGGMTVPQASVTIRVPSERLDEALERIKTGAGTVRSENVSGKDVTREYTDLQSRLRNLEAAEAQLTEIMADAYNTEDVLQVYNNLVDVREQIEVIKGQMQYYQQAAALSSISVDIVADEADQPIQIGGWQPVGVAKDAIEALVHALQGLINAAIWIVIFVLPVLVLIAIPLWLIWRGIRWLFRRRKKKKQARAEAKDAPAASDEGK
ncbi:MAG: DUF4349 domain-containing protein [Chloroflexota bacterium]|nr:DUF4349 domain-containing protein [Chloroflexota bacterium]